MQLQWISNAAANALHVADCSLRFADLFVDGDLAARFHDCAVDLDNHLRSMGNSKSQFLWQQLIASSLEASSGHAIAAHACLKHSFSEDEASIQTCGSKITEVVALFNRSFPKFSEQIEYRSRPLQDQWLGFGTGLLKHISRLTSEGIIPQSVRVLPYQPVLNGYCESHIYNNAIGLEAVLTNPVPELPEVLRMAWGIAQLNLELPSYSDELNRETLLAIAPLAMLPPVLAAAQIMDLSSCSNDIVEVAIEQWHIPVPSEMNIHDDVVPILMSWWETFLQAKPSVHVGIQALVKMLGN